MSAPSDRKPGFPRISPERFAALSPEDQRRVGTAMQFLLEVNKVHLEGMQIVADMLGGKTPADELGMKLMDYERTLRIAANEMTTRPLEVVHADALRSGQTKLDARTWTMRVRVRASDARKLREQEAREESLRTSEAPATSDDVQDAPDLGPRP